LTHWRQVRRPTSSIARKKRKPQRREESDTKPLVKSTNVRGGPGRRKRERTPPIRTQQKKKERASEDCNKGCVNNVKNTRSNSKPSGGEWGERGVTTEG